MVGGSLGFLVDKFGEPIGKPARAIDPCPFGCVDELGNPNMFLGCHLPLSYMAHAGYESRRGGVDHPAQLLRTADRTSKHYFSAKGKDAEKYVQALAAETLFLDWCFQNPTASPGKELCDLLVVFGDTAVIFQVKDVKADKKTGKFKEQDIEKNHAQLVGARRQLLELKRKVKLTNQRRGEVVVDPEQIRRMHLVSVLIGHAPNGAPMAEIYKGAKIHVFSGEFLATLLNELDTAKDLFDYLSARERLFEPNVHVMCRDNENSLLAGYIASGHTFEFLKPDRINFFETTVWKGFVKSRGYKEKKLADKPSYIWDELIAGLHAGLSADDGSVSYERLAHIMASTTRDERRMIVKSFTRGLAIATALDRPADKDTASRFLNDRSNKVTYCFFYYDPDISPETLEEMFTYSCLSARYKFPNKTVVGIACCPRSKDESLRWQFRMFEQEELSADEARILKEIAAQVKLTEGEVRTYAEKLLPDLRTK